MTLARARGVAAGSARLGKGRVPAGDAWWGNHGAASGKGGNGGGENVGNYSFGGKENETVENETLSFVEKLSFKENGFMEIIEIWRIYERGGGIKILFFMTLSVIKKTRLFRMTQ